MGTETTGRNKVRNFNKQSQRTCKKWIYEITDMTKKRWL